MQISAINDLKLNDYIGSSLQVQTQGSITVEDIVLENTAISNSPGLILQSGLSEVQPSAIGGSYRVTDLTLPGDIYSEAHDINNSGQVVGQSANDGRVYAFLYSNNQMIDLGTLPGDIQSSAYGINNLGQVVGDSINDQPFLHSYPFLYSNGQITNLGTFPGESRAYSINNSGQVVGFCSTNWYFQSYAFLYSNGQMTNLGTLPGGDRSAAFDINDSGMVVGASNSSNNPYFYQAFLYNNGQMIDLGTLPGGSYSRAFGINNSGQVVGYSDNSIGRIHAFLYSDGQMTDLNTLPESWESFAYDINNSGQIVGHSNLLLDNLWIGHAFLYSDGQMIDLNSLIPQDSGWTLIDANAINDRGQIVGRGFIGEQIHAFLLDPLNFTATPEDGINVGNISTKGDSILLNGLKITLTGSSITTNGGEMTFDGPTILESSTDELVIDSTVSADGSGGGNITFKDKLDGHSANTQSLIFKAGQGNITFTQAIGGKATVKDLTVNIAKTVTAEDINSDGDIILKVIDDISTANLSTNDFSKIKISLGKIDEQLYNSSGNVTTGSITAQEIDILSDGGFTATGNIEAQDGDVDIIALKDITVGQITAGNGATNLTSGTGAITVTGTIESKNGFIALAKQDITTSEIKSTQGVVILNTHQGAITVNGNISSYGDVSLSAPEDVMAQEISSEDGGVALISASGTVTANGAISAIEDVTLGAASDVVAGEITAQFGTVALVSTESSVRVNGTLYGGLGVEILARQNLSTGNVGSYEGAVVLKSEQSTVTMGNVVTEGGDIYISAFSNVVLQNLISNGGAITVISEQGAVTTGYLRSDGYSKGGKIYLQAFGYIRVISSVNISDTEYSIYTGIKKKGEITIVPQSSVLKLKNKAKFIIGNASLNGTLADVSKPPVLKPQPKPTQPGRGGLILIIIEIFRRTLDAGIADTPTQVDAINPITNKPYSDPQERELVRKFTDNQIDEIVKYVNDSRYRLDFDEIEEKGEFSLATDEQNRRCFGIPLTFHLGTYELHKEYATYVTGSKGDYILIPPSPVANRFSIIYDGKVQAGSAATKPSPLPSQSFNAVGVEPVGALAEVKTGHHFLLNIIDNSASQSDREKFARLLAQVRQEALIAKACHRSYFLSFEHSLGVARAAAYLINRSLSSEGISVRVRYIDFF